MPELDAVTQEFEANVRPYLDAMEEAKLATESLRNAIVEAVAEAQAAFASMGDSARDVAGSILYADAAERNLADATANLTVQTTLLAGMDERLAAVQRDVAGSALELMGMNDLLKASFDGLDAQLDAVIVHLAAVQAALDATTANAGRSTGLWIGWFRASATAIHWIVAGTAELLAVLVPAAVAAGAWAAVWLQGATDVYQHLTAVFDATEALGQAAGKTYGEEIGLTGALQAAQNAADPQVFQALGGAINLVREDSGGLISVGTRLGETFDDFAARVVADFQKGGQAASEMGELLSHMYADLRDIGQIFGNLGAAIGSLASQMPGLAEFLLGTLDHLTELVKVVIEAAGAFHIGSWSLLTFVIALEEFNRWGSLAVGGMGKLGLATTELSGKTGSYFLMGGRFIGVLKNMISFLPMVGFAILGLAAKIPVLGAALIGTTEDVNAAKAAFAEWIDGLSALQTLGIAAAAAALGFLIYKLVTFRTAAQATVDSMQQLTENAKATDVFQTIAGNISDLTEKINANNQSVRQDSAGLYQGGNAADAFRTGVSSASIAIRQATSDNETYRQGMLQQAQDADQAITGANQLAKALGLSVPDAMALAQSAGASLAETMKNANGTWTTNAEKVFDADAGYKAMGQSVGALSNDINALAIDTGVASSKVQTLNQAWDDYMTTVTGGTSDVANIIQGLQNVGTGIANVSENLSIGTAKFNASTTQFATDLTEVNSKGAQATQNFDQLISTVTSLADWMRQAALETGASGQTMNEAALDAVSGLIPLAEKSKTAQSQVLDLAHDMGWSGTSFQQLTDDADKQGASMKDLTGIVDKLTQQLGNMSGVAQQLGTTMNSQVASAISNAALQASGFYADTNNLTQALKTNGLVGGHTAAYWAQQAGQAYDNAGDMAAKMTGQEGAATRQTQQLAGALRSASGNWYATMHVQTDYTQMGSPPGVGTPGGGGHLTQHGGVVGGPFGTDRVPAMLTAGEAVLTARAVSALGGPLAIHAINDSPQAIVQAGGYGAGGGGPTSMTMNVKVMLDGSQIGSSQRTSLLTYNRRNPSNNWNLRVR